MVYIRLQSRDLREQNADSMSREHGGRECEAEDLDHAPEHTISMRKVLQNCQKLLASAAAWHAAPSCSEDAIMLTQACSAARSVPSLRRETLQTIMHSDDGDGAVDPSKVVTVVDHVMTTGDFRRTFCHANRPCKIRDSEWCHAHFSRALECWTRKPTMTRHGSRINRSWFEEHLGDRDACLPVRYQSTTYSSDEEDNVDEDGRAVECETRNMSLGEWMEILDSPPQDKACASRYLKDWHLQKWLQDTFPTEEPLYQVPAQFQTDLLNSLLLRFTKGDYRFTYWGPAGSRTGLHSDVLNSFSWSFNVCGTKEWTFYVPSCTSGTLNGETPSTANERSRVNQSTAVTIRQEAGECVFVPAGWKHHVANISETLSINHNWITTANLDRTWQCMRSEMQAVDQELLAWSTNNATDWGAKEFMLRGCIGLDVTAFLFMVLLGLLEKLQCTDEPNWEHYFDVVRLHDMLYDLLMDPELHLLDRLHAILHSEELGRAAMETVKRTVEICGTKIKATGVV